MANYKTSIGIVLQHEGGYANDKDDRGGETYRGIARKFHQNWEGWFIVDRHKKEANFPRCLKTDITLNDMVVRFYKKEFWDKIGGDKIKSEKIALQLIDSAVNEGIKSAVARAEEIVGLPKSGNIDPALLSKLSKL